MHTGVLAAGFECRIFLALSYCKSGLKCLVLKAYFPAMSFAHLSNCVKDWSPSKRSRSSLLSFSTSQTIWNVAWDGKSIPNCSPAQGWQCWQQCAVWRLWGCSGLLHRASVRDLPPILTFSFKEQAYSYLDLQLSFFPAPEADFN